MGDIDQDRISEILGSTTRPAGSARFGGFGASGVRAVKGEAMGEKVPSPPSEFTRYRVLVWSNVGAWSNDNRSHFDLSGAVEERKALLETGVPASHLSIQAIRYETVPPPEGD